MKKNKTLSLVIDNEVLLQYNQYYFSIHTKAKKEPIPHPYHESINVWMIMRRPMMNSLKQKWKDFIKWLVEIQGYSNLRIEKCEIEQTVYYPNNRRHDIDNTVPKFILDGLVESGMIVDDDHLHITKLILSCGIDTINPRTEIKIKINNERKDD
ncbi:MAG: hypothetical protein MJZ03_00170 [archaeon]|nr:hypothetical protein [archaeon]